MKINGTGKRVMMEGIATEGLDFVKIHDLIGKGDIPVKGFFFSHSKKYNQDQVVVVAEGYLINMPGRAVDEFQTILDTPQYKQALLDGKMVLKDLEELETASGTTTAYDIDIPEEYCK